MRLLVEVFVFFALVFRVFVHVVGVVVVLKVAINELELLVVFIVCVCCCVSRDIVCVAGPNVRVDEICN